MLTPRRSAFHVHDLKRAALSPIAERYGLNFDIAAAVSPASQEALALEALRCCSDLLIPFAYEDAWPRHDRSLRKISKKAAALVRDSFFEDHGRDAIAWLARRYGQLYAEERRRAAESPPELADAYLATAEVDEWLAGLIARI